MPPYTFILKSDGTYEDWRPSIHMPKEASRILEVTDVRVEKLQGYNGGYYRGIEEY